MDHKKVLKWYQDRSGLAGRYRVVEFIDGAGPGAVRGGTTCRETSDFANLPNARYQYSAYLFEALLHLAGFHVAALDPSERRSMIPMQIGEMRFLRKCRAGEKITLEARMRAQDDEGLAWDARGIDDQGRDHHAGLWVADALGFGLSLAGPERTLIGKDGGGCGQGSPRINRSRRDFRSWKGTCFLCIFTLWAMCRRNPQRMWNARGRRPGQAPPRLHPVGPPCGDGKSYLETLSICRQNCSPNSGGPRRAWQTPSPVGSISGSGHLLQRGWRKSLGCSLWR